MFTSLAQQHNTMTPLGIKTQTLQAQWLVHQTLSLSISYENQCYTKMFTTSHTKAFSLIVSINLWLIQIKDTIATGTEKLVHIGVDMGYFLPENDLSEQSNLESGKLCTTIELVN